MNNTEIVPTESVSKIEKRGADIRAAAGRCEIIDDDAFGKAGSFLSIIKNVRREIDDTFDGPIASAFAAHKAIVAAKRKHSEPVDDAERIVKSKMAAYRQKQEDEARERQRAAEAEARRIQEEARRVAEAEARKKAEEARAAEVARLKAEGDKRAAAAAAKAAIYVPPVVMPLPAPVSVAYVAPAVAAGVSFREKWTASVSDLPALIRAVADGKAPLALLIPDASMLNKHAATYKDKSPIPGVTFHVEKIVAAR